MHIKEGVISRTILWPQQSVAVVATNENKLASPEQIEKVRKGEGAFYVFGYITYTDVFNKERWTTYMFLQGGLAGCNSDALAGAPNGNETEESREDGFASRIDYAIKLAGDAEAENAALKAENAELKRRLATQVAH